MRDSIEKKISVKKQENIFYFIFKKFCFGGLERVCERRVTIVQSARATIEKVDIFKNSLRARVFFFYESSPS
jgi:hypothetical protein